MPLNKETIDVKRTYLDMIKNSVGSTMWRRLWLITEDGRRKDVLQDGRAACALYVSSILTLFELIDAPHPTVAKVEKKLVEAGWKEVKKAEPGDVLIWEINETGHAHIGFLLSPKVAVSNSWSKQRVIKHHLTYNNTRKIDKILRYNWT